MSVKNTLLHRLNHSGVCEKHTPPRTESFVVSVKSTLLRRRTPLGMTSFKRHLIRGWRAVSATGLQGSGSSKRIVCSQTPISIRKLAIHVPHTIRHTRCICTTIYNMQQHNMYAASHSLHCRFSATHQDTALYNVYNMT